MAKAERRDDGNTAGRADKRKGHGTRALAYVRPAVEEIVRVIVRLEQIGLEEFRTETGIMEEI